MHGSARWLMRLGVLVAMTSGTLVAASAAGAVVPDPYACTGTLIVDVTATIKNEADSGVAGNVWALLRITEEARIYQESPTLFCLIETDHGWFNTFAGTSPGGTGTVSAGRHGWTTGIQRFEVTGTFQPLVPVSGDLGKFNFACDQAGNCPGNVRFSSLYFTGITGVTGAAFSETDTSRAHHHGAWSQTATTSVGDITG